MRIPSKYLKILGIAPGICVALLICLIAARAFLLLLTSEDREAKQKEKLANKWLNSTYQETLKITNDEPLATLRTPTAGISYGADLCVFGGAEQAFATHRSYSDVTKDYTEWLISKGWKQGTIPANEDTPITNLYYIPGKNFIRMLTISPNPAVGEYEVVYSIKLWFAEISCWPYCPGWMCPY